MAKDYTATAATALRLVEKFGKTVSVHQLATTPADGSMPWKGPTDPRTPYASTKSVKAVMVGPDSLVQMGLARADSDLVKSSSQVLIVAPGPSEQTDLTQYHEVTNGDEVMRITAATMLRPADLIILFFIGVAR